MARWFAFDGNKMLGVLEARDRYDAERAAAQRWGAQCRRVQSAASWAISEAERAVIRRDRIGKFGEPA